MGNTTRQRPPAAAMPKPSRDQADAALEEAKQKAIKGPPSPRVKPFGVGCVLLAALGVFGSVSFAIAIVAAICAHRWGLS